MNIYILILLILWKKIRIEGESSKKKKGIVPVWSVGKLHNNVTYINPKYIFSDLKNSLVDSIFKLLDTT